MTPQEKKAVLDEMRKTPLSEESIKEIQKFEKMSDEQQIEYLNTTGEAMSKEFKQIQALLDGKTLTEIAS